jgi:uncharacterized protein (TIGR02145 family)
MIKMNYTKEGLSLLIFIFITNIAFGQTISPDEASRLAKNQILHLSPHTYNNAREIVFSEQFTITEEKDTLYYVFNLENSQGWIILSAEKRVFPLLGWSPTGSYNLENQAPSFRSFFKRRKEYMLSVRQQKSIVPDHIAKAWNIIEKESGSKSLPKDEVISIEPMLGVLWNQGCGYNAWCPADVNGPCGRAFAGCVATAQGQIMKYWNYPQQGRSSHSYTTRYGELSVDFSQANYNWDEMPVAQPNNEVAKLLYHVGVSVDMDYNFDESAAYSASVRNSLTEYFRYSFRTRIHQVSNYPENRLIELITNELYNQRVLYYGACPDRITDDNPCHAFVIDGFMSYAGYYIFHFNFGWGGMANGYFYMQDLVGLGRNFSNPGELITGIAPSDCPVFDLPYTEDFETESADCWQSFNNGSKAFNWEEAFNQNRTPGGSHAATHSFWAMSKQPEDSYLISPAINLPENSGSQIELSFWSKNNCPDLYSNGKNSVMISVDGGNSFSQIWEPSEVEKNWTKIRISLDAFTGKTVHLAFRYEKYDAPDAHTWIVDDISVRLAEPAHPEVNTVSVFDITSGSATIVAQVSEQGDSQVTDRGVVWCTSPNPSLENHLSMINSEETNDIFTLKISGLTDQTTYYVRAWATNGQGTGYGNEKVFKAQTTLFVCGESTVTDVEGNEYTTVNIGNQCWLGENLKTTRYRNGLEINNPNCIVNFMNNEWGLDQDGAYLSWNNDEQFRTRYGAIYNLHAVKNENKVCPAGWHVPHDFEWMLLERNLGMTADMASTMGWRGSNEGSKLAGHRELWAFDALRKEPSFASSGFDATPSGWYPFPTFGQGNQLPDSETAWWTSSPSQGGNISRRISFDQSGIERNIRTSSQGHYIRCIRNLPYLNTLGVTNVTFTSANTGGWVNIYFDDAESQVTNKGLVWSTNANPDLENNQGMLAFGSGTDNFYHNLENLSPRTAYYVKAFAENSLGVTYGNAVKFYTLGPVMPCPGEATITDADGNSYNTVQIGNQCWIAQNLKTTTNNLGDPIERICHDNNAGQCATLGGLYRWNTLLSGEPEGSHEMVQGICPAGWYLPKDQDWEELNGYLINYGYNYDHTLDNNLTAKSLSAPELWYNFANPPTGSPGNEPAKNNSSGFTAIPAGAFPANQTFIPSGESANFWSLSESVSNENASYYRQLHFQNKGLKTDSISKEAALSVRCFKYLNTNSVQPSESILNKLMVYPNPVKGGILNIKAPPGQGSWLFQVSDLAGRVVHLIQISFNADEVVKLDLSNLSGGLYNISLKHEETAVAYFEKIILTGE